MAVARVIRCELQPQKAPAKMGLVDSSMAGPDQVKVILQPRLCTLRSYAPGGGGVIRTVLRSPKVEGGDGVDEPNLSPFLENLFEYIESTKKSQDFEILIGRLAMMVFAATIGVELATGNSVFKKMDIQGIAEGAGACLAAVACAAAFAYSSSARKRVGRIFTISCNAFIDAFIDNIVDGLFYDSDPGDWSNKDKMDL